VESQPADWLAFEGPTSETDVGGFAPPAHAGARVSRPSRPASGRPDWLVPALLAAGAVAAGAAVFLGTLALAGPQENVFLGTGPGAVDAAGAQEARTLLTGSADAPGASPGLAQGLVVDVEGAVRAPGLHALAAGSRVGDAISAAGGYAGRADLALSSATLNLAAPLSDGQQVWVPSLGDQHAGGALPPGAPAALETTAAGPAGATLVDLNTADETGLESLPGIGPVTAGKIIAARADAPFASVDDLRTRGVVGQAEMDKIRELVTVMP
jgi:competence protein ComEA